MSAQTTPDIAVEILISFFINMLRIRLFEEKVAELLPEIKCPVHLYIGQEAVAVGVCANLRNTDYVFSTHRSHGHYIAKGGDMNTLMAELHGKKTGCSHGHGGSMHIAQRNVGLMGSSAIVAGSIPLALGTALASSMDGKDNVSVAFFGDGATNEGVFYESLNFASLKKLPIVFVCENNLYSTHMPISQCLANPNIYQTASVFGLASMRVNGNDIIQVYNTAKNAIASARRGSPGLIECMTYRWCGHVGANDDINKGLRSQGELDLWKSRCPIDNFEEYLLQQRILSISDTKQIRNNINEEITKAILFAEESPYPEG
jgi:pyruvate dehydrogenase E1 component alpha subunit